MRNKFRPFRWRSVSGIVQRMKDGSIKPATPLAKAMEKKQMSASELARLINTTRQNVGRWASGKVPLPIKRAQEIAPLLTVTVESLVLGQEPAEQASHETVSYVHIRGNVAAGVWVEHDDASQMIEELPIVGGRWRSLEQVAYRVSGPSMERKRIFDGDYVIAVPYFDARRNLTSEDVVVVERKRGGLTERTVKELIVTREGCELWPRSDDPRYQTPVYANQHGEGHEDDGTTVEVTGLVIFRGSHVA